MVKESDRSLRLRLFLLPNLPSGEIMPDNFIKAIIGVLAKNNFFPFCYNKINLVVTKYIQIFNIIVTFENKVICYYIFTSIIIPHKIK